MALIELNNVSKAFDSNVILQDTNLSVNQGEFVSIIGYSGSGKTTLISLIAGLQKPTSGEAKFDGEIISGTGLERGMVFQNYSLLPWLTVEENVALAVEAAFPAWKGRTIWTSRRPRFLGTGEHEQHRVRIFDLQIL